MPETMTFPAPSPPAGTGGPPAGESRLAALLAAAGAGEGASRSTLDGVKFLRATRDYPRHPVMYEPGIVIIAQGRKRGFLDGEVYTYDPGHYLVVALPLPFECETQAAPARPLLGVKVRVDLAVLGELLLKAGPLPPPGGTPGPAMYAARLEAPLEDAAVRLVECLRDGQDAAVLGPQIIREITWRALRGQHGGSLRALASMHGHLWPIHRALQRFHENYAKPCSVASLAREAAMSVSAFHQHFRAATGASPLQYVKAVRLQKARLLLAHERLGAAETAARVGYESASQFNREFKRFFGLAPLSEAARLREEWSSQGREAGEDLLA